MTRFLPRRAVITLGVAVLGLLTAGAGSLPASGHPAAPGAPFASVPVGAVSGAPPPGPPTPTINGSDLLGTDRVLSQPATTVYDPQDGYLYTTNFGAPQLGGNTVSITNATTNAYLATIPSGDDPIDVVYNPSDQDVYVENYGVTHNLSVIRGLKSIGEVQTGVGPDWTAYDPDNQYLYVGNSFNANVSIVSGLTVVATINAGVTPLEPAFDAANGWVYFPNAGSNNVTVINGTTLQATIAVGNNPISATYDPADEEVYVTDAQGDNVTVINGTRIVATVPVGVLPEFAVYDPLDACVYVADQGSNSVHLIHGTTLVANLSVGQYPRDFAFDPASGDVYVADWTSDDVTVINMTHVVAQVTVGTSPYSIAYNSVGQEVVVTNFDSNNISFIGTPASSYPVTVSETGLPSGTSWAARFGATTFRVPNTAVEFPWANGTYPWTIPPLADFAATVPSGVSKVEAAPLNLSISFESIYPVRFVESGLPGGTAWSVTCGGQEVPGTTAVLEIAEPNGTDYPYTFGRVSGFLTPAGGNVSINGSGATIDVQYVPIPFPLRFDEIGLELGSAWSVRIGSTTVDSTGYSAVLDEPNGTYEYFLTAPSGYAAEPPTGNFSLRGAPLVLDVQFNLTFPVTFAASGLPNGADWSIHVAGAVLAGTGATLATDEVNGTYSFTAATTSPGYGPSDSPAQVVVVGGATRVVVPFALLPQNATPDGLVFAESGLPAGTSWSVDLNGNSSYASTGTIGFWLAPGTYPYSVTASGYVSTPSGGVVEVGSGTSTVGVRFLTSFLERYGTEFRPVGLSGSVAWSVTVSGATHTSYGATPINLSLTNGTYAYSIAYVSGYLVLHSGVLTVDGAASVVNLTFEPVRYQVTFLEVGLPFGAAWTVTLGGVPNTSTSSSLTFREGNGTFAYTVTGPSGFSVPAGGGVAVDGANATAVTIHFVRASATSSAAPALTLDIVAGVAVLAVAIVLGALFLRGRRGGRTPPGTLVGPVPPEGPEQP